MNALTKFTLLALTILMAILLPRIKPPESEVAVTVCFSIIMCSYAVLKITSEFQKVFLVFGLVRNPAYPWIAANHTFRSCLHLFGTVVKPLLCLIYLAILIMKVTSYSSVTFVTHELLETVALARSLRWVWQNTDCLLLEVVIYQLYVWLHLPQPTEEVSLPVCLMAVSLLRDRLRQIIDKTFLLVTVSVSAMVSRRSYAPHLIKLNFILAPAVLAVVAMTSAIGAPILPLFTLPVFLVSCPRTVRFWPDQQEEKGDQVSEEAAYYHQLSEPLVTAIHQTSLGDDKLFNNHIISSTI